MDEFLATIKIFAGNFAPRGWMFCDGRLLPINQYTALFSLIGNYYGGDGRTNFALPDLRGRFPIGAGNGGSLTPVQLGEVGGTPSTTLHPNELPYGLQPTELLIPETGTKQTIFAGYVNQQLIPVETQSPYLGINYIICYEGIYPTRE